MPSTLEFCEKFYGTRDVYTIFAVAKDAQESEIKKAYYKLSLKVHPDRVKESEKENATEKFKVLSKIYAILSDKAKRALYDEHGIIDDDDDCSGSQWLSMWQQFFKPISVEDINNFEKTYIGSEMERNDIKKSYLNGKGCINYMMDHVQFMQCADEPRIIGIVKELIAAGEVPEFKICTEEPKVKRDRRHKRYAREAKEVAAMQKVEKEKKDPKESLEQQIALHQKERERRFTSMLEKYSQVEDDEAYSIDDYTANKTPKGKSEPKKTPQKQEIKSKNRKILAGRVSKKTI
ncbi:J domain-containing protein CG6693 [Ochlerotatus camptorhynchus]|uniref:J domain-containing protein CG6693 n=1 Tax=Ochlerotatus camptorhynchus TaxID=644619 RepID=UPI0031D831B1